MPKRRSFAGLGGTFLFALAAAQMGCATGAAVQKGKTQLWAENCARCHNMRSPSSYDDSEWDIVMLHMRARANLTAKEYAAIAEFLQADPSR